MRVTSIDPKQTYPSTFTADDVIEADVSLTVNRFVEIGSVKVLADEAIALGKGSYDSQNAAVGRFYALFKDGAGVALPKGKFRIEIRSSQDQPVTKRPTFLEVDLAALAAGSTVLGDRFVFPFAGEFLGEDRVIKFSIKNTTAGAITLSKANSTVLMDITRAIM
ncbi:MAG TPA: hypothetical protein VEA58_08535 [Anaerovoracaceae bacterium]|nr:hypothetical protein [Anaerovoracaceae bacterium]